MRDNRMAHLRLVQTEQMRNNRLAEFDLWVVETEQLRRHLCFDLGTIHFEFQQQIPAPGPYRTNNPLPDELGPDAETDKNGFVWSDLMAEIDAEIEKGTG